MRRWKALGAVAGATMLLAGAGALVRSPRRTDWRPSRARHPGPHRGVPGVPGRFFAFLLPAGSHRLEGFTDDPGVSAVSPGSAILYDARGNELLAGSLPNHGSLSRVPREAGVA